MSESDEPRHDNLPYNIYRQGYPSVKLDRDRSVLVLGETGAGKTEQFKILLCQVLRDRNNSDPVVVFNYKDDYTEFFDQSSYINDSDILRVSLRNSDRIWNVFDEVESKAEFEEVGRALFAKEEAESQNPFFPKAARQVFVAVLKKLFQSSGPMNNHLLTSIFEENSPEELRQHALDGFRREQAHLSDEATRMRASVYSHLQIVVTELFKHDFRCDPTADDESRKIFSINSYMKEPNDRILLLDFPLASGESIKPVFKFYIDWAIRRGLENKESTSYFFLDEFQSIPDLELIERLVNAGRSRNAYSVLGLQSVAQLQGMYGNPTANAILSGLTQEILLRPGDKESVKYIRESIGRELKTQRIADPKQDDDSPESKYAPDEDFQEVLREQYPEFASESKLQRLPVGKAIVLPSGSLSESELQPRQLRELDDVRSEIFSGEPNHEDDSTDTTQSNSTLDGWEPLTPGEDEVE